MTTRNLNDLVMHVDASPKAPKHRGRRNQRKAAVRPHLRFRFDGTFINTQPIHARAPNLKWISKIGERVTGLNVRYWVY